LKSICFLQFVLQKAEVSWHCQASSVADQIESADCQAPARESAPLVTIESRKSSNQLDTCERPSVFPCEDGKKIPPGAAHRHKIELRQCDPAGPVMPERTWAATRYGARKRLDLLRMAGIGCRRQSEAVTQRIARGARLSGAGLRASAPAGACAVCELAHGAAHE